MFSISKSSKKLVREISKRASYSLLFFLSPPGQGVCFCYCSSRCLCRVLHHTLPSTHRRPTRWPHKALSTYSDLRKLVLTTTIIITIISVNTTIIAMGKFQSRTWSFFPQNKMGENEERRKNSRPMMRLQ